MKSGWEIRLKEEDIPLSEEKIQKMRESLIKCQNNKDCIIIIKKFPMTIEEILKIVKQKHKKAAIALAGNIFWEDELYEYSIQINRWDYTTIDYECYFVDYNDDDADIYYKEKLSIDNNILEIKHLLGLPISKKDFMNWIEEKEIDKNLFKDLKVPEDNKYWRLYNIIKNLS